MIKKLLLTLSFLIILMPLFASGKKEVDERPVEELESWQETFDINEKKAGKYNIMITAADKGGNITLGGPFNIFIDPESDLPVSGITNPRNNMRVPGNLNIVGTCIDDDAVGRVEIVLDGDTENPIVAEGTDFWSYFLDTTKMEEGAHTISVYGIDNKGVIGHEQTVTWHLDRRQPQTKVENYAMGALVSGKIKLTGIIADGNGIKSLAYSLDGGRNFNPVSISEDKKNNGWTFTLPLNTLQMKDGASVCWFKAVDLQGTSGLYSYLYFVDNTAPEVHITYPSETDIVNGVFSAAGLSRDAINVESLSWVFGAESGTFELIPGNPFWSLNLDVRGVTAKTQDLIVTAKDTAGNITVLKRKVLIDNEADKSKVTISSPEPNQIIENKVFLRGIAADDDGIAEIFYSIDNGAPVSFASEGVFLAEITKDLAANLAVGPHSVKVWAKDIHGVDGNPVVVPFVVSGPAPEFTDRSVYKGKKSGDETVLYVNGLTIHPEHEASYTTKISSPCGLASVSWSFTGQPSQTKEFAGAKGINSLTIPLQNTYWGSTNLIITATDIYGRKTQEIANFYVTNLTKTRGETAVIFSDSNIPENGLIFLDGKDTVSGYFTGGTAASARIVPSTPFASVTLENNILTIVPGSASGISDRVRVEVTTDQGVVYNSRYLQFQTPVTPPVIDVRNTTVYDGLRDVSVTGTVTGKMPVAAVSYRVIAANTPAPEWQVLPVSSTGSFTLNLKPAAFADGMSVVEFEAIDTGKNVSNNAVFVRKITPLPADSKSTTQPFSKPVISWFDGADVYYGVTYSGTLTLQSFTIGTEVLTSGYSPVSGIIKRSSLKAGDTVLELKAADEEAKPVTSRFTAKKDTNAVIQFVSANGVPYKSGVKVPVAFTADPSKNETLLVAVTSDFSITSFGYTINTGTQVKVTPKKSVENPALFEVEIPLKGLAAELTDISVSVETSRGKPVSKKGTISIVREKSAAEIQDERKVYWQEKKENEGSLYFVEKGKTLSAYANFTGPLTAQLAEPNPLLGVTVSGNIIYITAIDIGTYNDIVLKVQDREGNTYLSDPVSIHVDGENPAITVVEPVNTQWVHNTLQVKGYVQEATELAQLMYSLDEGKSWFNIETEKKGQIEFAQDIDLGLTAEGLTVLDLKATDKAGKEDIVRLALHKDTADPSADVVLPRSGDVVNGETRIVFSVKDAGRLAKAEYVVLSEELPEDYPVVEGEEIPEGPYEVKRNSLELAPFITALVGVGEQALYDEMLFEFTDAAGNVTKKDFYDFIIDAYSDLPVAEIHVPSDNEIIQTDFVISGVVYDDDGASKIWYKIDNGEFVSLDGYGSSYSIPVLLSSMTDNEHTVTVYAEDIHGVIGEPVVRPFRISLEEPKGAVETPTIDLTVKDRVQITGWASDANGISLVQVSVDNGSSFNNVAGTEEWTYEFDTKVIQDGTHVVFLKVWDNYNVQALYSSLINIDNTKPDISLELPVDDSKTTGTLFFSGQTTDNIGLTKLYAQIRNLDSRQAPVPENLAYLEFIPDEIITRGIDISALSDGFYNIEMTGEDAGGNITRVSRNIQLLKGTDLASIDILYPLNGEHVQGMFNLYGKVYSEKPMETLIMYIDDQDAGTAEITESGYFVFTLNPEVIAEGMHKIQVRGLLEGSRVVSSIEQFVNYKPSGPWVTVDNFTMGDFAFDRPYLEGNAGYAFTETELLSLQDKATPKDVRQALLAKSVDYIEISFDNGKTFEKIGTKRKWRYRVENEDMSAGYHFMVVRAVMRNGESAVTRTIIQIDKTAPTIKIISPQEGGRFNEFIEFAGLTSDDVSLKSVTLALRSGDKASYEVPAFIQGLYFDWHFWGATLWDIGAGLTFFDDNVRLQLQFGQFTEEQWGLFSEEPFRYGGNVIGGKLLANIGTVPFRYFFGPNWEWLSANLTLGANFSMFTQTQSGSPQMLSAILAQLEFPRVTIPKQKMFRVFAFYTEGQLWFIPTDIESVDPNNPIPKIVPQISGGIRINVF